MYEDISTTNVQGITFNGSTGENAYYTDAINLLANQAQMDIFEQYFYELDQAKRRPSETTTFSDMVELINHKLI